MKKIISNIIIFLKFPIDIFLAAIIIFPALIFLFFRRLGSRRLKLTSYLLKKNRYLAN